MEFSFIQKTLLVAMVMSLGACATQLSREAKNIVVVTESQKENACESIQLVVGESGSVADSEGVALRKALNKAGALGANGFFVLSRSADSSAGATLTGEALKCDMNLMRSEKYEARTAILEGLSRATGMRMNIVEYYMTNGAMPASNQELGISGPTSFAQNALETLEIVEGGGIRLTFNEQSGVDGGVIDLLPTLEQESGSVGWRCVTSSYSDIESWSPQCKYR